MNRKRLPKIVLCSACALALAGGALLAAAEYQAGHTFAPAESARALNKNQVVFPEEDKPSAASERTEQDDSQLWEKDRTAQDNTSPQQSDAADYLFESSQLPAGADTQNAALSGGSVSSARSGEGGANVVYDLTQDTSRADVVLDGSAAGGPESTAVPGSGDGTGDGKGSGSTTVQPTAAPMPTLAPDTPAPQPTQTPAPTAKPRPADTVQDPVVVKPSPGIWGGITHRYTESAKDTLEKLPYHLIFNSTENALYAGLKLTDRELFNYLDSSFMAATDNDEFLTYYLTAEDYGKYIRIDAVSFDGGTTWVTDFPITIPDDCAENDMQIKGAYRLAASDDWTEFNRTYYGIKQGRVLVLRQPLASDTTQLDDSQILNPPSSQYGSSSPMPLLSYLQDLLGNGPLSNLFPGWTEDDEPVGWFYTFTPGRHILEALPTVPLDTDLYQVELVQGHVSPDLQVWLRGATSPDEALLAYLQTLTHYKGATTYDAETGCDYLDILQVPQYVQAVYMPYQPGLAVGSITLPDSVFYVDTAGIDPLQAMDYSSGLMVKNSYSVSPDNPRYATNGDGLLYNKDMTAIEGVPTDMTQLTVPASITQVTLPYGSKLQNLTLAAASLDELPEVNYARLPRTSTVNVADALLDDFLLANADQLQTTGLHVASVDDPAHRYCVKDDMAVTDAGMLHRILTDAMHWADLPDTITGLEDSALQGSGIATLMLPKNGDSFTFDPGCFTGAEDLKVIGCYSDAQYQAALAAVNAAGRDHAIDVVRMDGDDDAQPGWAYLEDGAGKILLLQAPDTLTEFDGSIPLQNGSTLPVDGIADGVFKNHEKLTWVTLPDSTTAIGYQAFQGCTNLQGVIIGKAPSITIAQKAFADCPSLRFVASNAANGNIECDDLALPFNNSAGNDTYTFLFTLDGATGYNGNWNHFSTSDRITAFSLQDCGGTMVLYGETGDDPWLALRSGSTASGTVQLPQSTAEICKGAFQYTHAANGLLTLNWAELGDTLGWIDAEAFAGSDLGGDLTMPEDISCGERAFADCVKLTSMTLPGTDISLHSGTFQGCTELTTVTFGGFYPYSGLMTDTFNECPALTSLTFTSPNPPRLQLMYPNIDYHFDSATWSNAEEEANHLHLNVPEGSAENFIEDWRYALLGYADAGNTSAYQAMWGDVYMDLYFNSLPDEPTDEEVRAAIDAKLLQAENRARRMMGLEEVTSIAHRYTYTVDDGLVTLTGAYGIEYTELTASELEMPNGWCLDFIGTKAFTQSPNLRTVFLPEGLVGIQDSAFYGVTFDATDLTDGLMIVRADEEHVPALLIKTEGQPFSFGISDSRVNVVDLHSGGMDYDAYIQAWTLPMAGYSSLVNMRNAVTDSLTKNGTAPAKATVEAEMERQLHIAENRVRRVLSGCALLGDKDPITYRGLDDSTDTATLRLDAATPESALALPAATPEPEDTANSDTEADAPAGDADNSATDTNEPDPAAATPESAQSASDPVPTGGA